MKLTTDDLIDLQKFLQEEINWVHTQLQHNHHKGIQEIFEQKHSHLDQLRLLVDHFLRKRI